jgi:hypothetical protein
MTEDETVLVVKESLFPCQSHSKTTAKGYCRTVPRTGVLVMGGPVVDEVVGWGCQTGEGGREMGAGVICGTVAVGTGTGVMTMGARGVTGGGLPD